MEITKEKLAKLYKLVFLVPLVVFPLMLNQFELAKQGYLFIVIGVWMLLAASVFVEKKNLKIKFPKLLVSYLGLMAISFLISSIFSVSPYESVFGSYDYLQGLTTNVLYLIHTLIVFYLIDDDYLDSILMLTVWVGTFLSIYAISQKIGFDPLHQNALGTFSGRSSSFMGQPNFLGQFLIYPLLILFRNLYHKKGNLYLQGGLFLINTLALYFSYNRASILALVIGISILIVINLKSEKAKLTVAAVGSVSFLLLSFALINNNFRSLGSRAVIWEASINSISEAPLIGTGPETSYRNLQKNISPKLYEYEPMFSIIGNAHNETLQILLNRGLLGLVPYFLYIYFVLCCIFKSKRETPQLLAVILASSLVANQFSFSGSGHYVFLIFFAVALIKKQDLKSYNKKLNSVFFAVLTIVFGASLLFVGARVIQADFAAREASDSYFTSTKQSSFELYQKSQNLNPFFSEYFRMSLVFLADDVSSSQTSVWMETYNKLTSGNFRSNLYQAENNPNNYAKYIDLAILQAPNYPLVYQINGELALNNDEYQTLVESSIKLLSFVPNYPEWDSEKKRIFRKTHTRLFDILLEALPQAKTNADTKNAQEIQRFLSEFEVGLNY